MDLPTQRQCLDYFEQYKVPLNVRAHCHNVNAVAVFLAKKLNQLGIDVDVEFVGRLALLHDLFKAVSIRVKEPNRFHSYRFSDEEIAARKLLREKFPGMHEGEVAHKVFSEKFPELALSLKHLGNPQKKKSWEEMIVFYADGRVLRSQIVTLPERMDYLVQAYPTRMALFEESKKLLEGFENKLTEMTNMQPGELAAQIKATETEDIEHGR